MAVKKEDLASIGMSIYEEIRAEMEANEWGRVVVIDVNSGDYEVADDDLTATMRLFERRPDALTWGERVGNRAIHYMGFRATYGEIMDVKELMDKVESKMPTNEWLEKVRKRKEASQTRITAAEILEARDADRK